MQACPTMAHGPQTASNVAPQDHKLLTLLCDFYDIFHESLPHRSTVGCIGNDRMLWREGCKVVHASHLTLATYAQLSQNPHVLHVTCTCAT